MTYKSPITNAPTPWKSIGDLAAKIAKRIAENEAAKK
jgi:hypothetical protein